MKKNTENNLNDFEDENIGKTEVIAGAALVPYVKTTEIAIAIDDFTKNIRKAIAVGQDDWPKGRTLEFTLEFAVVPKLIRAKFGQK